MAQQTQQSPPASEAPGTIRDDLKIIASRQKVIIFCILVYLLAVIVRVAVPLNLQLALSLVVLAAGVVAMVFVFMLAMKLYSLPVAIVLGLLTLVPLLGLVSLLVVNGKATGVLKANGIAVGLFGARGV